MKKMLDAGRKFHEKHDFQNTGGHSILYRMNIIKDTICKKKIGVELLGIKIGGQIKC